MAEGIVSLDLPAQRFQPQHILQQEAGPVETAQLEQRATAIQHDARLPLAVQVDAVQFGFAPCLPGQVTRQQVELALGAMHEQRRVVEKTHVFAVFESDGGDVEPLRGIAFGEPGGTVLHAVQMEDRRHRLGLQGGQRWPGGRTQQARRALQGGFQRGQQHGGDMLALPANRTGAATLQGAVRCAGAGIQVDRHLPALELGGQQR
ncbi:hypothetical protein D3C72_1304530 [compost metagenome]